MSKITAFDLNRALPALFSSFVRLHPEYAGDKSMDVLELHQAFESWLREDLGFEEAEGLHIKGWQTPQFVSTSLEPQDHTGGEQILGLHSVFALGNHNHWKFRPARYPFTPKSFDLNMENHNRLFFDGNSKNSFNRATFKIKSHNQIYWNMAWNPEFHCEDYNVIYNGDNDMSNCLPYYEMTGSHNYVNSNFTNLMRQRFHTDTVGSIFDSQNVWIDDYQSSKASFLAISQFVCRYERGKLGFEQKSRRALYWVWSPGQSVYEQDPKHQDLIDESSERYQHCEVIGLQAVKLCDLPLVGMQSLFEVLPNEAFPSGDDEDLAFFLKPHENALEIVEREIQAQLPRAAVDDFMKTLGYLKTFAPPSEDGND